jgi:hypothetical protein
VCQRGTHPLAASHYFHGSWRYIHFSSDLTMKKVIAVRLYRCKGFWQSIRKRQQLLFTAADDVSLGVLSEIRF